VLNRIVTIARYTALETVRQRVPMVLVFFGIGLTLGALFLGQLSVRQDGKLLADFGLAAIDLFGSLIAIFLGTDLISKEIQRRSLYPLLAKPLRRHELVFGRYLGLLATLTWNVALMGLALMGVLYLTFGQADPRMLIAVFGVLLSVTLLAAISVLFSSTSSPILALVLTLAAAFIGRQSDILRNIHQAATGISDGVAKTLYFALPNFRYLDFKNAVVYGDGISADILVTASIYVVLYAAALLVAAAVLFRSRDLA
jgi:ABC-type transport system involved in multi-copper enzyme maturation permease subunit